MMEIERIVTRCLEAIEQGETVEACLARYPDHAQELAPLLQLALSLRKQPKPRLSDRAFQAGRMAVAAAAAHAAETRQLPLTPPAAAPENGTYTNGTQENGMLSARVTNGHLHNRNGSDHAAQRNGHHSRRSSGHRHPLLRRLLTKRTHTTAHVATAALLSTEHGQYQSAGQNRSRRRRPFAQRQRHSQAIFAGVVMLLVVISTAALLQQIAVSVPGTPLYEIKTAGQQAQGLFLRAAGEGAAWHARQATQQISELAQHPAENEERTAEAVGQIAEHVQQALVEAALLATDQQQQFYATWLADLTDIEDALQQTAAPNAQAIVVLAQVQAQVTAAAGKESPVEIIPAAVTPATTPASTVDGDANVDGKGDADVPELQKSNLGQDHAQEATEATAFPTVVMTSTTSPGAIPSTVTATAETAGVDPLTTAATTVDARVAPAAAPGATPTPLLRATAMPSTAPATAPQRPTATRRATSTPLPVITRVMPLQTAKDDPADETSVDGSSERPQVESLRDENPAPTPTESMQDDTTTPDTSSTATFTGEPANPNEDDGDAGDAVTATPGALPTGTAIATAAGTETGLPTAMVTPSPAANPPAATATLVPTQPTIPTTPKATATPAAPARETPAATATGVSPRRTLQATPDAPDEATPRATDTAGSDAGSDEDEATPETTVLEPDEQPSTSDTPEATAPQPPAATPQPTAIEAPATDPSPTEEEVRPRRTRRPRNTETATPPDDDAAYLE